jgi:succinoglycan biosynthesis transport protein ExoP
MDELTLSDYTAILRRWKKLFLITLAIMATLFTLFALRWSNYRSTATVQIEQSQITASATTPLGSNPHDAMEALADQHISELQQKVTSAATLIEIITKFDLYAGARKHKPIADVADDMRKKIKIDLVSGSLANPAAAGRVSAEDLSAIAFTLGFTYSDPLTAQRVTDELVTRFLDEDLKERRTQTEETSAFLGAQITTMEASLSEQEKKIADYQKEHGVSRPETLAFNQQAAATTLMNLQNLDSQLANNEGNIGTLRAQLTNVDAYSRVLAEGQILTTPSVQLKALQAQYAALTAQYGPEHPDVVKVRHQIAALQGQVGRPSKSTGVLKSQIADTQTQLDIASKTYGPEHPDVVALKNKLQSLEDRLATQHSGVEGGADGIIADADNPAYLQISAQLKAAEEQHKSLTQQREQMRKQQEEYQGAVTQNPEAMQEMAALSRDYDNSQLRYRELKEKKMSADMDQQMQSDRKGQRLTLIDPPELPQDTHPARLLLVIGGFFMATLFACAAVVIAQIISRAIVGAHHLEMVTGHPPLVVIPHLYTAEEREKSLQHKLRLLWNIITQRVGIS